MKNSLLLSALLVGATAFASAPKVDNVEPPMWWTGMQSHQLQLMVEGDGIRDAVPSIDYAGVEIDSVARLDSPNYQFIYLTISENARPGEMTIKFKQGKKEFAQPYTLLARDKKGEDYGGFDSSDVLYLLMPDRFSDGDPSNNNIIIAQESKCDRSKHGARHGGDLKGIQNHLDYLNDLGVTAVWLTPVLENDMPGGSYHGYNTTNYYRVDPRYGTNEEYRSFIAECHNKGIKVVMDMIFNHCGLFHRWMTDLPSKDWINSPLTPEDMAALQEAMADEELGKGKGDFKMPKEYVATNFRLNTNHDPYVSDYDLNNTVNGWFVPSMPDLNQRNVHLMTYLIQSSIWWVEYAKIDGIRMDTYPYADLGAMASWNKAVMNEYPNFNIVGESWLENEGSVAFMQRLSKVNPLNTELKAVMDFPFLIMSRAAFSEQTKPWGDGMNRLYNHLALDNLYPDPSNLLIFLDNHDSDRFLLSEPDNLDQWKQAITFLLTSRGIPQIYYGTELLMNGTKEGSDGKVRLDMPGGFPGDEHNLFVGEGRSPKQNEAFRFLSNLLKWRKNNVAVTKGEMKHFMPSNLLYVYERKMGDSRCIVLMNGTDEPLNVDMSRYEEIMQDGDEFIDVLTNKPVKIHKNMTFAPRATLVLE